MSRKSYATIKVNDHVELPANGKILIANALSSEPKIKMGIVTKVWDDNTFLFKYGYNTVKVTPKKTLFGSRPTMRLWVNGRLVDYRFNLKNNRRAAFFGILKKIIPERKK